MAYYWVPRAGDRDDQDHHRESDQPQPAPKFMQRKCASAGGDAGKEWIDGYVPKYTYPKCPHGDDNTALEGHKLQTRPMVLEGHELQTKGSPAWAGYSNWRGYTRAGGNAGYEETFMHTAYTANSFMGMQENASTGSPAESGDAGYEETFMHTAYAANSFMGMQEKASTGSPAESSDEVPMTQEAITVRGQILVIELELSAWMALEDVAETEDDPAVKESVAIAKRYLKCPSQSTLSAALALHEISNAAAGMGPSPAQEKLVEVEKAVRDVVVCRCQLATAFGVRHLFVKELQKVFDYPKLDSNARSKLMHSHRTIFGDWPGVFKSHCTAHARLRSMRKSEKQQQLKRSAGAYEAGAAGFGDWPAL